MNCFLEALAGAWIFGLRTVNRGALEEDLVASAREQLQESLGKVAAQNETYAAQIADVARTVRERRSTLPKAELRKLLLRSRRLRLDQAALDKKTTMMEAQLNALDTNEFNKTVLTTLQTSAKAMQKMGLGRDLQNTDQVISELEEGMQSSSDMNAALAGPLSADLAIDDADLDAELGEILGLEEAAPVFAAKAPPAATAPEAQPNSMDEPLPEVPAEEPALPVA